MSPELLVQYTVAGVTYGAIYAAVAIGFNIIYNATGVINFAQGEFVMLGGMIAVTLSRHLPLPLAIATAVAAVALLGALVEVVFFRWLDRPGVLRMIIITIGLSIVIREVAFHIWGPAVRSLPYFTGSEVSSIRLLGAHVSPQVLWVIGTTSLMVAALTLFFQRSLAGRQMRACALNRDAARLCGVNARAMVTISFMLSAAIGALAGCVIAPITYAQYDNGTGLAVKGFTAAILGGLGSSPGAVVGGLALGLIESFSVSVLPAAYKDVVAIALLLAVLFVRPSGILGSAEAARLRDF